ncbi:MAG: hypothetical protein GY856_28125 [bacterium]|nr:hypothetical protein [bacterium]
MELTMEFIRRLPFVWPTINIPVPFGGTPLYENYLDEDRILRAMPFSFYYMPYLVTKLKNYHPLEYYGNLVKIFTLASSGKMLMRRLSSARMTGLRPLHTLRTLGMRCDLTRLRRIQGRLRDDSEFRAFHEGRSDKLPAFYRRRYAEGLGRYSELISEAEMRPVLEPPSRVVGSTPSRSGKRGISRIDRHIAVAVSSNPSAPEEGERPSAGG